jgi:uncharacterized membrane protein
MLPVKRVIASATRAVPGVPKFDPSFVVLAMVASVEAIFLPTFVLISQNRMMAAADKRADLDLHVSLLTEHELTKLVGLVTVLSRRMNSAPSRPGSRARGGANMEAASPRPRACSAPEPCRPGTPAQHGRSVDERSVDEKTNAQWMNKSSSHPK